MYAEKEIEIDETVVTLANDEVVSTVRTIKKIDVIRNQVKARGENPLDTWKWRLSRR